MPGPSAARTNSTWFPGIDPRSVEDFWCAYDAAMADRRAVADSELARLPVDTTARIGNFDAYEAALRRQARRCAELGLGLDTLQRSYAGLAGDLGPELVRAYASSPVRLRGVLNAMALLITRELSVLGGEYRSATPASYIGDGVVAVDETGAVTTMNASAQSMTGWDLTEARGRPLDDVFRLVDEQTGKRVDLQLAAVLDRGVVQSLPKHPVLVARDDSPTCSVTESMAPVRDQDGTCRGAVLVFRDQNVERAHSRALEASQAQTMAILEASLDTVITMDEDGRIHEFSGSGEQMFGVDRDSMLGRRFPDAVLPPAARGAYDVGFGHSTVLGTRRETVAVRSDLVQFPVEIAVVRTKDSGPTAFTCFIRDLTASKQAEDALNRSRAQLRALAARVESAREEERTRIARELHDQLGQQLTALRLDLGWIARRGVPTDVMERVRAMQALVDTTFEMVRRLGTELRPGILDDLGLVATLEWRAREFTARTGTAVAFEADQALPPIDPGRATALFRIFQEILTNVARHSEATHVDARLVRDEGDLRLTVVDNGRGIARLDLANTDSLGLLGMRERAELLGGTFDIRPAPEGGTMVTIRLPDQPAVSTSNPTSPSP